MGALFQDRLADWPSVVTEDSDSVMLDTGFMISEAVLPVKQGLEDYM
jgi:hypothetical protein